MQVIERLGVGDVGLGRAAPGWPERLGRAGLVGRGVLYVVIGWLAIRLAFGDTSAHADQKGALQAVATQPLGRVLLFVLAGLFAAYASYRLALAVLDPDDAGPVKRAFYGWRTLFYGFLTWAAVSLAVGSAGDSGDRERDLTVRALALPLGRWIVVVFGLGVIAAGVWHGSRVVTGKFADDLKHDEMPDRIAATVRVIGSVGTVARMVSFALVGSFLVRVGWRFDPSSPVGLDESLARVRQASWGPLALVVVGAGLVAFGLFAIARAKYQRMLDS